MNLYEKMMTPCVRMERKGSDDGEGGSRTEWIAGEQIDAAIVRDTSTAAKVAEKEGVTSVYTITTKRNVLLGFHDVIKRLSDGKIFRVTSDIGDKVSPGMSLIDISQVTAEKWEVTDNKGSSS